MSVTLAGLLGVRALGQETARYAGRPFVQIARGGVSDPTAGSITGFGRAQVAGDSVVFIPMNGVEATGLFAGRGGPLEPVAGKGTSAAGDVFGAFHDGFARTTVPGPALAFAAGTTKADAIYRWTGTSFVRLLASGSPLPDSGGRVANVIGEPHLAGDALAVIAAHRPATGLDDFRGVYRVKDGALVAVADTVHELPGGFGIPDAFSSQVGFDGRVLAFWAGRGPSSAAQGMFAQDESGTLVTVARTGDPLPDGGSVARMISPPFVADGAVYFFAHDATGSARLLRYAAGTLGVLARDGDATPEGSPIQSLGQLGLAVEGGRVYFAALSGSGAGVYVIDGGSLRTVVAPGVVVAGLRPTSIVLQDVADDTVVLEVVSGVNRRLAANLPRPAVPVILQSPTNTTVAVGARVEWRVTAAGDAPLAYRWQWSSPTGLVTRSTSDTLVIESADAVDVGFYSIQVTNAAGIATAPGFQLNVQAPPRLLSQSASIRIEAGDPLQIPAIALGGLPLGYFWSKDGAAVTSDSAVAVPFVRTSVRVEDAGRYRLVVSNAWGQVTSDEIAVEVLPPGPNPTYGGGQFVGVFDSRTLIPGTSETFATEGLSEFSAQLRGTRVVFSGGTSANPREGVFSWEGGTLDTVVRAGVALPNGLGNATGFTLVDAADDGPVVVYGYQPVNGFPQPVGIYRIAATGLEVVVDVKTPVPGDPAATFPPFLGGAAYAGGRLIFGAVMGGKPGLYLAEDGRVRPLVGPGQDLPAVGTGAIQFTGLSFDGTRATAVAATAGLQKEAALRFGLDGSVSVVVSKDDPIPGTTDTIRSLGQTRIAGDSVYLAAFNAAFAPTLLEVRDGTVQRLAAPGTAVGTLGTIQRITSARPVIGGGRAYLAVAINLGTGGSMRAIVAAGPTGVEPVLVASKLDGQRITDSFVIAAATDQVLAGTFLSSGTRALYANLGTLAPSAPRLEFQRGPGGGLRLLVPAGTFLQSVPTLGESWTDFPGSGEVNLPTEGEAKYFRLRRP